MDNNEDFIVSQYHLMPLMEQMLEKGEKVRFRVSGNSMWPWIIHNRDSVLLIPCDVHNLKKGEIILFQTQMGNYVLHRITKVVPGGYVTTGDGNCHRDGFISCERVKAKASIIYRKEKRINCDSLPWKCVSAFWMKTFPVRRQMQHFIKIIWKLKKKEHGSQ